jgi:glutaredoxin
VKAVNVIIILLIAAVIGSGFFLGDKIYRHLNKGNALSAVSRAVQDKEKSDSASPGKADSGTQKNITTTAREARDIRVVIYMTDWCPYCTKAREYIRAQGVHLVEYNIERDRGASEEMARKTGGRRGVPVIDVEGIILRGYNPQAIANAIKQKQNG